MGLGEQLNDVGIQCGYTLPVNFNDAMPHEDVPVLGDATWKETAELERTGKPVLLSRSCLGLPAPNPVPGWGLTMLSSTQKPSCSQVWGQWMMAC